MQRTVLVFPVKPGVTREQAWQIADLFTSSPKEYRESRDRLGISLERAYYQPTPMGDFVCAYAESENDASKIVRQMAGSDLPIDKEFARLVSEIHGVDISQPPPGAPAETIGAWVDPDVTTRGRGMGFCAPFLPSAEAEGRQFSKEAYDARRDELTASRRGFGQSIEVVTLHDTPHGPITGIYLEGPDPVEANRKFAASTDPYDLWFKGELAKLYVPQVDFSKPVPPVEEMFDSVAIASS